MGIGYDFTVGWNSLGFVEFAWIGSGVGSAALEFWPENPWESTFSEQSLFFCKLSLSDSIIPHWFPLNRSHFCLALLTVSCSYAVCLTQRSAFCSSPSADCSIHLFTHLLLLLLFSIPLCLHLCRRYPGMLIYKLTVKTWPILFRAPPPPLPVPSAKRKAKWWGDRRGRRQKAEWMLRIWFASQKKDETKNLNVYEQLVSICLPLSLEKGKLG